MLWFEAVQVFRGNHIDAILSKSLATVFCMDGLRSDCVISDTSLAIFTSVVLDFSIDTTRVLVIRSRFYCKHRQVGFAGYIIQLDHGEAIQIQSTSGVGHKCQTTCDIYVQLAY